MYRKKVAVLVINQGKNEEKNYNDTKVENVNLGLKSKKKFKPFKLLFPVFVLSVGVYYYLNQEYVNKLANSYISNELKSDIKIDSEASSAIFGDKDKSSEENNTKKELANNVSSEQMREEILKRKQAEEFSSSEGNKDIISENTSNDENLPIVNINPNSIDSKVDKIDYKNNPNKDIANSQVASNSNENNPNSISKDLIEKELNMLIRNSTFAVNAKADSISIFINNINHKIGDNILNNSKFKLKNISFKCIENKMPIFSYEISDENNNTVLSRDINYSENKKIVLFFDSLSVVDKNSNIENIYLPGESIFKGFSLSDIKEINSVLKFDFVCEGNKTSVSGKELSEVY